MQRRTVFGLLIASLGLATYLVGRADRVAAAPAQSEEELWRHRNLGKAFYENPTTQKEAVEELHQALSLAPNSLRDRLNYGLALLRAGRTADGVAELERVQREDPALPHTWFNLGIAWLKDSQYERALPQLQRMSELVPAEPITHYNLGVLYKATGKSEQSLAEFERAARLAPRLAGPHFRLYTAYKALGRAADAARELELFQAIKKEQAQAAVPEDLEWSTYAELYDPPVEAAPATAGAAAAPAVVRFEAREIGRLAAGPSGLAPIDVAGDGHPGLLAWSAAGIALWRGGATAAQPVAGLEAVRGVVDVAVGDFNNDGLPDLCVLTTQGAQLFVNQGGGRYAEVAAHLPQRSFRRALFLDFDHDYDSDLLLLGDRSALIRNDGTAGWSDHTADFPFVSGKVLDAVLIDPLTESPGIDVVMTYLDHPGMRFRDLLGGHYAAEPIDGLPPGARGLLAADLNADGATDLLAAVGADGPAKGAVAFFNRMGRFAPPTVLAALGAPPLAVADLGNRALPDVVAGGVLLRGQIGGTFTAAAASPFGAVAPPWNAVVAADFDRDGREDLAVAAADGKLILLRNVSGSGSSLTVNLTGVRNPKMAIGARVEIKAGSVYQKKLYDGTPLHFGLRGRTQVDTVRITWPNGLIQNETRQAATNLPGEMRSVKEAQRLSGSCPMIFTWNGQSFGFITDVLGVAPLGASLGDGQYFPVDHDEWVQIPGEALMPGTPADEPRASGRPLAVRITEELHEVTYLDRVRLLAVDHPVGLEILTNEKFKSPPFPSFQLFGVSRPVRPQRAVDGNGRDVLPALLARDGVYVEGFHHTLGGVAESHSLELDFGPTAAPDNRAILVLNGWVDWADGSTFRAASQESTAGLELPHLEVRDAAGQWRTAVADMGIPAGKPKTIVVDLTGKFLSASREVRIVTNLCVYWDEIYLGESSAAPAARLTEAPMLSADLHFRGFSLPVVDPDRQRPEAFDYGRLLASSSWNPTPGLYTRYGDVRTLLARVDDEFVILGSGDEVRLHFAGDRLPPLPAGWRRDYLLDVDGWAKDADPNTAFSRTVEPLPFHAMSAYPYPGKEHFPDDAEHQRWRALYNRRPALRLLAPLNPVSPAGSR